MQSQARVLNERYELGQLLGEGGFGSVYAAYDHKQHVRCAVKVLTAAAAFAPNLRGRFLREAEIVASLSHPNIVHITEVGIDRGTGVPFIAMEQLTGADLWQYIAGYGALPPTQAAFVLQGVASAISHAHLAHVVHRDLKPANVFVTKTNETPVVKVLDFGLAKRMQGDTKNSGVVGTPGWMAPEQLGNDEVGPATDVWSFALLSFFLLAGREYWLGAGGPGADLLKVNAELFAYDRREPASLRARRFGVEWALDGSGYDEWFATCIAWSPSERFASMAGAARALFHVLATVGVPPHFLTLDPLSLGAPRSDRLADLPAAPSSQAISGTIAQAPQASSVRVLSSEKTYHAPSDTMASPDEPLVDTAVGELQRRTRAIDVDRLRTETRAWTQAMKLVVVPSPASPAAAATPMARGAPPFVNPPPSPVGADFEHGRVNIDLAAGVLAVPGTTIPGAAISRCQKNTKRSHAELMLLMNIASGLMVCAAVVLWMQPRGYRGDVGGYAFNLPALGGYAFLLAVVLLVVGRVVGRRVTTLEIVLTTGERLVLPDIHEDRVADQCLRAIDQIRRGP